jgi:hypothetical protein
MFRRPLIFLLLLFGPGCAFGADEVIYSLDRPLVLPPTAVLMPLDPSATPSRPNRIRLFRMQPGFLYGPPGLDQDDPNLAAFGPQPEEGVDWLQLTMGNDNPFFDVRRPGDPGGIGYYRVHSQVQLFDSQTTSCTINLQAVRPAGRDQNGVDSGPTILTPAIGLYQEVLDDGTALHCFVGKHMPFASRGGPLQRGMQCGLGLQRPLWPGGPAGSDSIYLTLGALGRIRFDDANAGPTPAWDMMPGLHWQLTPNSWVAGSLILPVNSIGRADGTGWQFTLSWQF